LPQTVFDPSLEVDGERAVARDLHRRVGDLTAGLGRGSERGFDVVHEPIGPNHGLFRRAQRRTHPDQASDRVHRIGQKRAVQIFKLITEGTLEEKIATSIAKKRQLISSVITADDPKLSKIFTREELLDLLALPG